jgi:(p)ppGpp synthase/HD superfamily hydrolase
MRLTIHSLQQLTRILDKLNRVPNVIEARRVTNAESQQQL